MPGISEHNRTIVAQHRRRAEAYAKLTGSMAGQKPVTQTSATGPMPYTAVLATSHPEEYSREELLEAMRADALSGQDRPGFKAQLADDEATVTCSMSAVIWTKEAVRPASASRR